MASRDPRFITEQLASEISRAGYYPEVVLDVIDSALAGEAVEHYIVQTDTTFTEGLHRHLTTLVLTRTRLLITHVDDATGEDAVSMAVASTEMVPLNKIQSVAVTHGMTRPATDARLEEISIAVQWGAVRRIEMEPMMCGDPTCEGPHGLSGVLVPDDIVIRVVRSVEGTEAVYRALAFGNALSAATVGTLE